MNGVEFSESPSSSLVLFAFQVLHSPLWATQCGKLPPSILDVLKPMDLELDIQRGPLIGGFLHPYCYGVPGKVDTCRALRQQFYVPTSVFAEDGLIIATSQTVACTRGRTAAHFGMGGNAANPLRDYATKSSAIAALRGSSPSAVSLPAITWCVRFNIKNKRQVLC